jgi:regulator of cell morphogenesis and NO signaling
LSQDHLFKAAPMPIDPPTSGSAAQPDWRSASTKDLVAHIVDHHHAFARELLSRLELLLRAAVQEKGKAPSALSQVTVFFRELQQDLLAHFRMEEHNLFPAILAVEGGGPVPIALSTPAEVLLTIEAEHQAVEELFLNIRMVTADYNPGPQAGPSVRSLYQGLRDLEDDLHRHLYLENHLLFPRFLPPGQA